MLDMSCMPIIMLLAAYFSEVVPPILGLTRRIAQSKQIIKTENGDELRSVLVPANGKTGQSMWSRMNRKEAQEERIIRES